MQLHYVDVIFYVIKLCICLHNAMVVHCIDSKEYLESEDMYNVTIHIDNVMESSEKLKDDAYNCIYADDIF